jgi:hypothetical protein
MTTVTLSKSRVLNTLEGIALTAILQAFPTFASAVMILKLAHEHRLTSDPSRAMVFVPLASLISALLAWTFGPKFPRVFKTAYEPAFFDATLAFSEKVARWRARPETSLQLVTSVIMMSLLAVAVASLA